MHPFFLRPLLCPLLLGLILLTDAPRACADEEFVVHLDNYFLEQQGGQRVDIDITYGYEKMLERERMPDYREVVVLVEDALYSVRAPNLYWELTNREVVRRLLVHFPQFTFVESRFSVRPRAELNYRRSSIVRWTQAEVKKLGLEENFSADRFWTASEKGYRIVAPRCLKASLDGLRERLAAAGAGLDYVPYPLNGTEESYPALLGLAGAGGGYDAVILPEGATVSGLARRCQAGRLLGLMKVLAKDAADAGKPGCVEISLARTLGLGGADAEAKPLAEAREDFYRGGKHGFLILEERVALPYRQRSYEIKPFREFSPLWLCAAEGAKETPEAVQKALARWLTEPRNPD